MKRIVVVGLGAVGLPLALCYAQKDCCVYGVDANPEQLRKINNGIIEYQEEDQGVSIQEIIKKALAKGNLILNSDIPEITDPETVFMLVVPIAIINEKLDLINITEALINIGKRLIRGNTVLIRSTVFPGFTEEIALPILERESKLIAGRDFYLAYCPERMGEGMAFAELKNMEVILGAINLESFSRAKSVLGIISPSPVHQGTIKEVESSKIIENLQRDVNIALVNEISYFLAEKGISGKKSINLANTHKRVKLLSPGSGVGGHCIPWAYYYLKHITSTTKQLNLCQFARELNESVPEKIAGLVRKYCCGKDISSIKIAILGQAWKDFSASIRHSPAVALKRKLINEGYQIISYDPIAKSDVGLIAENLQQCLQGSSVLIIPVLQKEFLNIELSLLKNNLNPEALIIDLKDLFDREIILQEGFKVFNL